MCACLPASLSVGMITDKRKIFVFLFVFLCQVREDEELRRMAMPFSAHLCEARLRFALILEQETTTTKKT